MIIGETTVEVFGLIKRTDMNFKTGTIVGLCEDGRLVVRMNHSNQIVLVKRENLRVGAQSYGASALFTKPYSQKTKSDGSTSCTIS